MTTCSALVVSAAFFVFIPRMWVGAEVTLQDESESNSGVARKTGLATTVRLGDLGSILESTAPVFEIRLTNLRTKESMTAQQYAENLGMAEPLFRGAVLTTYARGQWSTDLPSQSLNIHGFDRVRTRADILQEIRLAPTNSDVLYCLGQPMAMSDANRNPVGEINEISGISTRGENRGDNSSFEYYAYTEMPKQQPLYHKTKVSQSVRSMYMSFRYYDVNKKVPARLRRLADLTKEILDAEIERKRIAEGRSAPRELTDLEIAETLESYLRDSGKYRYSLDMSIEDPDLDPIEDFLFNRMEGHCEYFATALALMIRSAKIPARIVSGYKGGIPHTSGGKNSLEVQQRFAHLWVEAWVDREGWTTFDATPMEERAQSIASVTAKKTSIWSDVQSTLSGLWSENVLNMTLDRQEESIYKPIRELAFSVGTFLTQLITSPKSAFQTLWKVLTDRERWFSVGGIIFAVTFVILLGGIVWIGRWVTWMVRVWAAKLIDRRSRPQRRVIEFYDRFVRLMNARGLQRRPTETQSEFADQVASAFSPELRAAGLRDSPGLISRLFYQVRFGDQELSTEDLEQMGQLLDKLELTLSTPHTT
jgi:transglutaminase-like putative cysteine protease